MYTPVNPSFKKVELKGGQIIQACFRDFLCFDQIKIQIQSNGLRYILHCFYLPTHPYPTPAEGM